MNTVLLPVLLLLLTFLVWEIEDQVLLIHVLKVTKNASLLKESRNIWQSFAILFLFKVYNGLVFWRMTERVLSKFVDKVF